MKKDFQLDYGGYNNKAVYRGKGNKRSFCITGSPLDKEGWIDDNLELIRLTDSGDGLVLQLFDRDEPIKLDYQQAEMIRLALKINNPTPQLSEITITPFKGL